MTGVGRRLTAGETALAAAVFGPAVRFDAVRLQEGGWGRWAVTVGSRVFLPPGLVRSDFAGAGVEAQALLIHELVHVWQFQTRPLRTLASWAGAVATGGYGPGLPAYRYRLPLAPFGTLGLERQASVVEHLFLLRRGRRTGAMPQALRLSDLEGETPFFPGG